MRNSVMPKGVEHPTPGPPYPRSRVMRNSVMPKGVEHQIQALALPGLSNMRNSVMPKGVEHPKLSWTAVPDAVCGIQ